MLHLEEGVWTQTLEVLRECGKGKRECVAYWLGLPGGDVVDEIAHPLHRASSGHYAVEDRWLNSFWSDLARRRKSVLAQVHTHQYEAFHSRTDDEYALIHTPGFLSLVVPDFACGEIAISRLFVAQLGSDGMYRASQLREQVEGLS